VLLLLAWFRWPSPAPPARVSSRWDRRHSPEFSGAPLPNVDRLRKEGNFKHLETSMPMQSPVAWSTFITGETQTQAGTSISYTAILRR